jgi:uncharacterized protein YukE
VTISERDNEARRAEEGFPDGRGLGELEDEIAAALEAVREAHAAALTGWSGRAARAAGKKFEAFYGEAESYKKMLGRAAGRRR